MGVHHTRQLVIKAIVVLISVSGLFHEIFNAERKVFLKGASLQEDTTQRTAEAEAADRIHLVHVISPYVVPDADDEFYPLDLNQWATMESVRRALKFVPESVMKVEFVCAIYAGDLKALSGAGLPCHRFVFLKRSTRTQYPKLEPKRELPFISDIVHAATSGLAKRNATFHVLLTNSDIGLTKGLYGRLFNFLQTHDALSINRMTISEDALTPTKNATDLLENQIYRLIGKGSKHLGYDFFCLSSSVLERVSFGDFFLGRPPWGANIHLMLSIMAENYTNIKSYPYGTFHIGNNASNWRRPTTYQFDEKLQALQKFCPHEAATVVDDLSSQNVMNCIQWFVGKQDLSQLMSKNETFYVPGFVRPGFEQFYLDHYSSHLRYGSWGTPQPIWQNTTEKRSRIVNMFSSMLSTNQQSRKRLGRARGQIRTKTNNAAARKETAKGSTSEFNHSEFHALLLKRGNSSHVSARAPSDVETG